MKLKQRVIVTGSLFLTMISLFLIGIHFGTQPDIPKRTSTGDVQGPSKERGSIKGPEKDPLLKVGGLNFPDVRKLPNFPQFFLDNSRRDWPQDRMDPPKGDAVYRKMLLAGRNLTKMQGPPARNVAERQLAELQRLRQWHERFQRSPYNDSTLLKFQVKYNADGMQGDLLNHPVIPEGAVMMSTDSAPGVKRKSPWVIWERWVKPNYLYPEGAFWSDDMDYIIDAMATAPITSFGLGHKGTQLKTTMYLGKQRTVFKPMRYPRDEVIAGDPYAGFDRHNAEIAGFHLDGILGFRIAPPVVGRKIDLSALRPVTSQALLSTYFLKDGNTCFYGKCFYCRREEAACAQEDIMEGSVTLWLPEWYELKTWRHPYQRTYRPGKKARWEVDDKYCEHLLQPSSEYYYGVLEFTDSCVFDFLMGNADRHHYETYAKASRHGRLMHIDNGKSFGNPHHDEMSILAPLTQCCRLRESTWEKLVSLQSSKKGPLSQVLDKSLKRDPMYPILTEDHLAAVDRRHSIILKAVDLCIQKHGRNTVIVSSWG